MVGRGNESVIKVNLKEIRNAGAKEIELNLSSFKEYITFTIR
jgi:hypothetical protein